MNEHIARLMALMVKYKYTPRWRFERGMADKPATQAQIAYIRRLIPNNQTAIAEITEMIYLAWGVTPTEWTMADAQFVIGALRQPTEERVKA